MKKKNTVALMSNEHNWTYNLRKELIQAMLEEGYRVVLILPYGEKVELLKQMGCEYYDVPMFERRGKNPFKEVTLLREYKKLLKKINPDVALTFTIKPNLYGGFICGRLSIPFIANITGLGTAVNNKGIIPILTKRLYKIGLKKATCIFAQNPSSKCYLENNRIADSSRIRLISGSGVNLARFSVKQYPTDDVIRFAFISRILKEKGIDEYLTAAMQIRKRYPNTEFHICGFCEDDYRGNLKERESDGTVVYHGMIDDVSVFLERIHCLVHPSYYLEGLSNVCLEAAASGRPVITTDHEGCRETVINQKTGFVIPVRDSDALVEAIDSFIKLTNGEKREMGIAARKYVEKCFDRSRIVNAYMKEISNF